MSWYVNLGFRVTQAMVVGKDMLVAHLEGDKANLEVLSKSHCTSSAKPAAGPARAG